MTELDDDFIDGCDINFASPSMFTSDEGAVGLALFADVEFTDPAAVEARKAEWAVLFAETEEPEEVPVVEEAPVVETVATEGAV